VGDLVSRKRCADIAETSLAGMRRHALFEGLHVIINLEVRPQRVRRARALTIGLNLPMTVDTRARRLRRTDATDFKDLASGFSLAGHRDSTGRRYAGAAVGRHSGRPGG
jgi:hypothetical protein